MMKWKTAGMVLILASALCLIPASGALFEIPKGGTAFIGEQHLDIRQTGAREASKIGWFGAGGPSGTPAAIAYVDDPADFFVDPKVFVNRTGLWYLVPDNTPAFTVADPSLSVRVYDDTGNFAVTGTDTGIPSGDHLEFRMETNLVAILSRPGISWFPVTIRVRQPDGNELVGVSNTSLADIPVNGSPYSTGPVWFTSVYPPGTYSVWAYCNVNGMNDNYPVDGKTRTSQQYDIEILPAGAGQTPTPARPPVSGTTATAATPSVTPETPVTTETPLPYPTPTPTPSPTTAPGPGLAVLAAGLAIAGLILWRRGTR